MELDRQCRLCFETEERTPFLSPCHCRGTQAYIHTHCLALYIRHFPDGMCRVCRQPMKDPQSDELLYTFAVITWMLALSYASTLPTDPRGMYLTLAGGVILYFLILRRKPLLFAVIGMMTSAIFLYSSSETILKLLVGLSAILTLLVLWMYIPTHILILATAILMTTLYSTLLLAYAAVHSTPLMTATLLCLVLFVWHCIVRARPPLRNV